MYWGYVTIKCSSLSKSFRSFLYGLDNVSKEGDEKMYEYESEDRRKYHAAINSQQLQLPALRLHGVVNYGDDVPLAFLLFPDALLSTDRFCETRALSSVAYP